MKKVTHKLTRSRVKRLSKSFTPKDKKKDMTVVHNPLVENARKLLSGDVHFFNKLKEKNRRKLSRDF